MVMFKGSMVALVTPMKHSAVDVPALCELVEYHVTAGTHAIVVTGTTGEAGTLSTTEKHLVIKTVVNQARERLPVIAGTASNSTAECVCLTRAAQTLGAHGALIMTPAYIKPTQHGLYEHYQHIALAVGMPIILYNVPSRTGCDLLPETVAKLAGTANIVGIKEATGTKERLEALKITAPNLDIFSGDDISALEWLLNGAKGVISVTANVAANAMAMLCEAALNHDKSRSLAINKTLKSLHEQLFIESNPIPVKWALYKMGLIENDIRLPLTPLTQAYQTNIEQILLKLDLLKH
tara:strand:+ start:345 stop:1226 length:882 start_codon:yes stop_codon:yes gene_type:complete